MRLAFSRESHFAQTSIGERGAKNSHPFIVICPALTFFFEKGFALDLYILNAFAGKIQI